MTQNEVSIIKNAVLDATEAYVDARLSMASFVKTEIGVVTANSTVNNKNYHTVQCNASSGSSGVTYTNVLSVGNIKFPVDSVVFLIAPNAQYSNQFILGKLDTSPANIVGGEIHIGEIIGTDPTQYYFNVNNAGNVVIQSGSIELTKMHDNRVSNDTYNFIANANGLRVGAYVYQPTSSTYAWTHHFIVNSSGTVSINQGSIDLGSGNFTVDNNGVVIIKSGSILLGARTVSGVQGYDVNINSTGLGLGLTGGTQSSPTYNFTVSSSGIVTINDGVIQMKKVTSSLIPNTSRYSVYLDEDELKLGAYVKNIGTQQQPSYVWDYKFSVSNNGYLISTSGKIGGADIYSDHLEYSSNSIFSRDRIGCGVAGEGIINLVGNNGRPYIALTDSGDYDTFTDGTVIYGVKGEGKNIERGVVRIYNGDSQEIAERYLANIPDGDIDDIIDDRLRHHGLI